MRRRVVRLLLLLTVPALFVVGYVVIAPGPSGRPPEWRRVLFDGFGGGRLDRRIWSAYQGQPGGDPGGWWEPSHVVVRNGVLSLDTYRDPALRDRWVSGGVSSARGLEQRYGRYLVRFRMGDGTGVAGVLLLWPKASHWPPEVDFAETGGERPQRSEMTATLHYAPGDQTIARTVHGDFTRWHVMGVEWTPRWLVYTLDGHVWATVHSRHVPSEPMELDIQSQAGTCGVSYAPCPDASTPARVGLQVDWVAAYARR